MNWIAYLAGAAAVLVYKLLSHLRQNKGRPWAALGEWFFERSGANAASWITTVGVVWMMGGYLIGSWSIGGTALPELHVSVLFTIGSLAELIAPSIAEGLVSAAPAIGAWFANLFKGRFQ